MKHRDVWERRLALLFNMRAQFALSDGIQKRAHFVFLARYLELHATIAQIFYCAGNVETFRDMLDGIAKPYALDIAFVENFDRSYHA